jgi:hypothetical protein
MKNHWNFDPAASGPRERALVGSGYFEDGKRFEMIVYHDGDWEVRGGPIGHALAGGHEPTLEAGKTRALRVYKALRRGDRALRKALTMGS